MAIIPYYITYHSPCDALLPPLTRVNSAEKIGR